MRELFAFRYVPPRANFPETLTPAEGEVIERHFLYLKDLHERGQVKLVGRCDSGLYGLALVWAESEAEAAGLFAADPAVRAGLFTGECERFLVVFDGR